MNINKCYSQDEKMLRKYEDSLTSLSLIVSLSKDYVEKENANTLKITFEEELNRVMIHGILHLCGCKDKTKKDKADMRLAEDKQLKLLKKML